jgi:hypothetical protein
MLLILYVEVIWKSKELNAVIDQDEEMIRRVMHTLSVENGAASVFDIYVHRPAIGAQHGTYDYYMQGHRAVAFIWQEWRVYILDPYVASTAPVALTSYLDRVSRFENSSFLINRHAYKMLWWALGEIEIWNTEDSTILKMINLLCLIS